MSSNLSLLSQRMSSRKVHDSYLSSQAMIALSKAMLLAGMILGFDIVELWSEDIDKSLLCAYVHANEDIMIKYPDIIVGHHPEHKREHKLSPQLCHYAKEAPNRCYWNIVDPNTRKTSQPMHPDLDKTEVCYWVEGDFGGMNIFIVGFSSRQIKMKPSKLKFLNGLGYAIFVAAFELDDEDDNEDSGKIAPAADHNDLDNKVFVPRAMSTPFSSVANLQTGQDGIPLNLSSLALTSSPPVNFGVSTGRVEILGQLFAESPRQGDEYVPRFSNDQLPRSDSTDSGDVGLTLNPSETNLQYDINAESNKIEVSTKMSVSSINSTFMPPSWAPIDAFAFHVADIPVRSWVPDNMTINHFQDVRHVADGSNSHIYLAKYDGVKVVVKMIKESAQYDSVAVHEFEVEHGLLIRINHPNIIKLLGAGRQPRRFIVLEYLGGGTLNTILSQNQASGITSKIFRRPSFTYGSLIAKLRDMAEAFDYLHTKCHTLASILHRDLKPDNVGFTDAGVLKLFDFGLCTCVKRRTTELEAYEMTGNTGSLRYMAPEVAMRKPYTEKVDVYSFGIMAWQMARDKIPFKGMGRDEFYRIVVVGGDRPQLDKAWPAGFSHLLTSCWSTDPLVRPSFSQIIVELSKLIDELSTKPTPKKGNKPVNGKNDTSKPSPPSSTWF